MPSQDLTKTDLEREAQAKSGGNIPTAKVPVKLEFGPARKGKVTPYGLGAKFQRTFNIWRKMVQRIDRPTDWEKKYYSGISVSSRWRVFADFLADMGECPPGYTIERIDNKGNYEPGNCKWATRKEQANNRRTSRFVTVDGVTKTIAQWAEATGIKQHTLAMRHRKGLPFLASVDPNGGLFRKDHKRNSHG